MKSDRFAWLARTILTFVLITIAWWLWNEVPRWLRGTEFADFSYVASLVLIIFLLSCAEVSFNWISSRFLKGSSDKSG